MSVHSLYQPVRTTCRNTQESAQVAYNKNLIWVLARQSKSDSQTIPSWTGFNIKTRDQESISEDVVGYLPTVNAPATELTTVYEILKQSDLIRKELSLDTLWLSWIKHSMQKPLKLPGSTETVFPMYF